MATRVDRFDRSAFSAFPVGFGVKLVQVRVEVVDPPNRWPARRLGPVYKLDPPGTCLICCGVGGCGWDEPGSTPHFTPCWACQSVDSIIESKAGPAAPE